eukprot:TRINITY_DN35274_c0_g1_i1.p1 TRINITY_DN35274_c0_g1~~TRINITY_DN35274_c0_g1_i1.p1  ORF type:complete len:530 (+),score=82.45 TRINITY_DN35274_c0_g1_i1:284-1873(+)
MEEVKKRWIRCLVGQQIVGAIVWAVGEAALSVSGAREQGGRTSSKFVWRVLSMILFQICLGFSLMAHCIVTSPVERQGVSPLKVLSAFVFRRSDVSLASRVRTLGDWILFVIVFSFTTFVASLSFLSSYYLAVRVWLVGVFYSVHYVFAKRWILTFPIIQRPLWFGLKMGIPSSAKTAFKMSFVAMPFSDIATLLLLGNVYSKERTGFLKNQFLFIVGAYLISFCWEITHHIIQVLHTRRFVFAPPQGSAAAETNPTDPLLEAVEGSAQRSLAQYLAYLDLCMASENKADSWRRAAFFEESGETYKTIVHACCRPLMNMAGALLSCMDVDSVDKSGDFLSQQMRDPTDCFCYENMDELFIDLQLCTWCARTLSTLTAVSHDEDRFGVAQIHRCNGIVVSTLLSCLLLVEIYLGKRNNVQPMQPFMGSSAIRWAVPAVAPPKSIGKKNSFPLKKKAAIHKKAFVMADVLRTSIYQIVGVFHDEMLLNHDSVPTNTIAFDQRSWLGDHEPLYGSRELLAKKLSLFLEFRAC